MLDELHQEGTDRVLDDLARRPGAVTQPDPKFSLWGLMKAPSAGIAAAGAERLGFAADVVGAFGEALATTEGSGGGMFALQSPRERTDSVRAADKIAGEGLSFSSEAGDLFRDVARSYRPDAVTAHAAERVVFDLSRGLAKVAGDIVTMGPAGAVVSAADEASMAADDLRLQGVDLETRATVGAVQGLGLGAGAVLPLAGSTLAKTAALYALGGPVGFMAQQQATRSILQAADYSSISMQYDPLDPVGLAVSSLIPLPFAAYGLRSARTKARVDLRPDQIDAARVAHVVQEQQARSLVDPGDLRGQAAEARAIETAEAQIARGERVNVADIVQEQAELGRAYDAVRAAPEGGRFDPLVEIKPADIEAVAVSRGGWKGLGDAEVTGQGFGLVKFIWRHGEESGKAPEFQVTRDDVLAFPEVIRRYEPSREAVEGGRGREWRVERDGRTVVYADNVVTGAEGRHLITMHVEKPGVTDTTVFSKEKPDWSESPGKRLEAHTRDTGRTLVARRGSDQSGDVILSAFADRVRAGVRAAEREAASQPTFRSYAEMSPAEQAAFDERHGIAPGRRKEVADKLEAMGQKEAKFKADAAAAFGPKAAEAISAVGPSKPAADSGGAPGSKAETDAVRARLAEIERQFPDLEVMLDGMDKPMRLADFMAAVKAEVDADLADAPLYQLAAECALLNGAS